MTESWESWSFESRVGAFLDFVVRGKGVLDLLARAAKTREAPLESYQLTVVL